MDELARQALLAQRVVDVRLEGDDAAGVALHLVALGRAGLDEELLLHETELAVRQLDGDRALAAHGGDQRGRVGRLERRLQRADALAELRPEHLEVGLDDVGDELVLAGRRGAGP